MQHITYRPIDRQFRCLQVDLPPGAPFNRVDPIDGITFGFALETRFPEEVYFGTVDGEAADNPAIELRAVTKAEYDAAYEAEQVAQQPAPLPPITLTVGSLVARFLVPDEDDQFAALDDAMMAESRLVKRNWLNDRYSFTEGDGFWTIVSGHLDGIVSAERKAELLAAASSASQSIAEPLAA